MAEALVVVIVLVGVFAHTVYRHYQFHNIDVKISALSTRIDILREDVNVMNEEIDEIDKDLGEILDNI